METTWNWFEIITEPEFRVNIGHVFIQELQLLESTRFWR